MRRWNQRGLVVAAVLATLLTFFSGAASAVPEPGAGRALWGGTEGLMGREASLGRPLDLVRIYTQWVSGPPAVDATRLSGLVAGGRRTLLVSASIPWESWRTEGQRRNSDADPANNVTMPWCKFTPRNPTTGQASGKTWFQAVAEGDYDAPVRRWLEQLAAVANGTPALYLTFHHEPERLSDENHSQYQGCVGTPAQYRAAYDRVVKLAQGAVGTPKPNLTRRSGTGPLVFVPIYTAWGFWHTAGTPTSPSKALVTPSTGQPLPGGSADDLSLRSARVTAWVPSPEDYDYLAVDVFNFSGSTAGGATPTNVRVDDPATTTRETDQWWSLEVLMRPVRLWTDNWGDLPDGSARPIMLAEYGSVPDPVRPGRRASWLGQACRYLSAPAQSRLLAASYFDINQMRLDLWTWRKVAAGRWTAVTRLGPDSQAIGAVRTMGASTRFGGTGACPP